MKASLKNYRQSPRKVRLVADLIKGKSIALATLELNHLPKRAALPIEKLLASAVANAKAQGAEADYLFVKEVRVDKGIVLKRHMPRAFGRASAINKRSSHVHLTLTEKNAPVKESAKKEEVKKEKKEKVATVKKPAAKKAKVAKK